MRSDRAGELQRVFVALQPSFQIVLHPNIGDRRVLGGADKSKSGGWIFLQHYRNRACQFENTFTHFQSSYEGYDVRMCFSRYVQQFAIGSVGIRNTRNDTWLQFPLLDQYVTQRLG